MPVIGTTPVSVVVSATAGEAVLRQQLGEICDVSKIAGAALATEGEAVVVTVPRTATRSEEIVRVVPADAVVRSPE